MTENSELKAAHERLQKDFEEQGENFARLRSRCGQLEDEVELKNELLYLQDVKLRKLRDPSQEKIEKQRIKIHKQKVELDSVKEQNGELISMIRYLMTNGIG